MIATAASMLGALCLASNVYAAETAQYSLKADKSQVSTGQNVELTLRCESASTPTAALILEFDLPQGYAVYDVENGSGVKSSELSYSYTDTTLNLLYLDDDGGNSPVQPGAEVAKITLTAATPGSGQPLTCTRTDASQVSGSGEVQTQAVSLTIDSLTVTGEAMPVPSTTPSFSTDGEKQSIEEVYTTAEKLEEQKNKQSSNSQDSAAPTATPNIVTDTNGNQIQIIGNEQEENNTVDVTEDVLNAQPATQPAAESSDSKQQQSAKLLWALSAVVVIGGGLAAFYWVKNKREHK